MWRKVSQPARQYSKVQHNHWPVQCSVSWQTRADHTSELFSSAYFIHRSLHYIGRPVPHILSLCVKRSAHQPLHLPSRHAALFACSYSDYFPYSLCEKGRDWKDREVTRDYRSTSFYSSNDADAICWCQCWCRCFSESHTSNLTSVIIDDLFLLAFPATICIKCGCYHHLLFLFLLLLCDC